MSDEEAGAEARHLDEVAAIEPGGEPEFSLANGTGFAVAVLVIMLAEQTFLNAGPLLVKATEGGAEGAALAGFTFNVLLIARAPLQLFQAVQTSILPHLTRLGARGETDPFKRSVNVTLTAIAGFAAVVAVGMAIAGPFAMDLVFGGEFDYDRLGLVLISVGMGLYLAAATLNQALLARNQARQACACWVVAALGLRRLPAGARVRRPGAAGGGGIRIWRAGAVRPALRAVPRRVGSDRWPSNRQWEKTHPTSSWRAPTARSGSPTTAARRCCCCSTPATRPRVCTKQFCSYRDNAEAFGALGVTAVGISGKDVGSKKSFQENHELNVPLLADPDGAVAQQYDAYAKRLKMTKRAAIIIDEDGKVAHRHDHTLGLDFQTVADLKKTLDSLPARA